MEKRNKILFLSAAILLLALSFFLHIWKLDTIPNGFFCDESAIGYNAYSILETGKDEYGTSYPLFFRCFDNYHEPVMVYTLVPLIKIFGLSKFIVRFTSAFYMILASVAFYFLAFHYCRKRWLSLAGAFIFSILPWAFPISRTTMSGYTPMLLGINIGWLFLLKAFAERSKISAVIAASGWAFAMYSHNCGRPMSALLLICFFLALNLGALKRWKISISFIGSFLLFMVPMIIYVLNNPQSMTRRFKTISVWQDSPAISVAAGRILSRYIEYFSPIFLFVSGDPNTRHSTGVSGLLYLFTIPLILIGLFMVIRKFRHNFYYRFALLGLLIYPFAGIVTIDYFHSTRTVNGLPFWTIIIIIGLNYLISQSKIDKINILNMKWMRFSVKQRISILLLLLTATIALSEMVLYFEDYFNIKKYPARSRLAFSAPVTEALQFSFKNLHNKEILYISTSVIQEINFKPFSYSTILFFGNISPAVYQKEEIPKERIIQYNGHISKPGILIRSNYIVGIDRKKGFFMQENREPIPEKHKLIASVTFSKKVGIIYEIYKVEPK
jgi:hypothetical protein